MAIILVLLRHQPIWDYTTHVGWIGVDLFFVLSGFLVSGLLFKEYGKFGTVKPVLFLIRRGFKIYPLYYLVLALYLILLPKKFYMPGLLGELIFVQNYATGFGWAYEASWSLAVEEHFYFGLTFLMMVLLKWSPRIGPDSARPGKLSSLEAVLLSVMVGCLLLRLGTNLVYHDKRTFTMTHLRIDSLAAGVLLSYNYYFRCSMLQRLFDRSRRYLVPMCLLLISFTPFIADPVESYFVKTVGFTLLYTAFTLLLFYFLMAPDINGLLNRYLSKPVATGISKIGLYSYAIYLVHMFVNAQVEIWYHDGNKYMAFAISFVVSMLLGKILSDSLEALFLRIRDRYFPSRSL
jgi:peptidoglycan/LPS O-acetylase OafA/YrhL